MPDLSRLTPREAWIWVRDHSDRYTPPEEISLVAVFFRQLAAVDPDVVLVFANESLLRPDGATIAAAAINALLENDRLDLARKQVERWSAAPEHPAIGASAQAVAWQLARRSEADAATWLLALPANAERDAAFAAIAGTWANHDADAAMTWTSNLPAGAARTAAMQRAFRVWADHDPDLAAQWLLAHETDGEADRLIGTWTATSSAVQENPRLALQWVALIRDPLQRERRQARVLEVWRERDPDGAARFASAPP